MKINYQYVAQHKIYGRCKKCNMAKWQKMADDCNSKKNKQKGEI